MPTVRWAKFIWLQSIQTISAADYQCRSIGTALTDFGLNWMKKAGMSVAMVEAGGDPGHAPARHTYEKSGFGLLPIARYFKKL